MTKVSIKRALLQARAVALVAAALVFTVAFVVAGPEQTPKLVVARSIDFKVTSATSGLSASPNAALLYPGAQRYLRYTSAGSSMGYALAQSLARLPASVSRLPAEGAPLAVPVITKGPGSLTYDTSVHFGFMDQGQHEGFSAGSTTPPLHRAAPRASLTTTLAWGGTASRCWRSVASSAARRRRSAGGCQPVLVRGEFTIGGNAAQPFYPGTSQALDLTITNPFKFAIKVLNVSITVDPRSTKSGCDGTVNLLVTEPLRATLAVPAESTKSLSELNGATRTNGRC